METKVGICRLRISHVFVFCGMAQIDHASIPLYDYHPEADELHSFKYFELGIYQDKTYVTTEPHRHGYYEIFYFPNGEGQHMIDFHGYPILQKSLHFVSPGQVHLLKRTGTTKGHVLLFSEEFFYFDTANRDFLRQIPFLEIGNQQRSLQLDAQFADEVEKLIGSIRLEYQSEAPEREAIIRSYINILLLKCKIKFAQTNSENEKQGVSHIVTQFKHKIDKEFQKTHRVSDYADYLSVSPNHLNDIVKKATGKTAGDLIQERIVLEAKRLLLYSTSTAKEIAYTLGFNDPAYFSRFFKNNTNQTPDEFRAQLREHYQIQKPTESL